ncbi:hypothetical protein ABZQ47_31250, partial [Pseudomonas aeruginosa]
HHFHTDHPVFSCSKIEQKQLNTWVSFQSAEQPLLGQFSVSGNIRLQLPVVSCVQTPKVGWPEFAGKPRPQPEAYENVILTSAH